MGKISLFALLLSLALGAVRDCRDDAVKVADLNNPFWSNVEVFQLLSGVSCKVDTTEDMKVEFASTDLSAVYIQYKLVSGSCTAISAEKTYYSGETLLTDFNTICGNYIAITNSGLNNQKFLVFRKNALQLAAYVFIVMVV
jgi:hypothetical protein